MISFKKIILLNVATILIIVLIGGIIIFFQNKKTIVYVDVVALNDNFLMKQDLEKKATATQMARKNIIDSMSVELKMLSKKIQTSKQTTDIQKFERLKELYYIRENQFVESNESQINEYKQQIWKQLQQYVKEFAEKKGIEAIIGFGDNYTVLYSTEQKDVTKELTDFINKKYKGASLQ